MSKIWVIQKKVNERPKLIEVDSDFRSIQKIVGGNFDLFRYSPILNESRIDIFLNDEGKMNGLEPTIVVLEQGTDKVLDYIVGNVLIASTNDCGDTISLSKEQIDIVEKVVFGEECLVSVGDEKYVCGVIRI